MTGKIEIRPQPGPQTKFLSTSADIAIYGGAAGAGKTWGLLFEPLRHIHNGNFGAVIFRRTYPQITQEGGMWDESVGLYLPLHGKPRIGNLDWQFPSGARVSFAHLQHEKDKFNYQGAQIALLEFDQLEQFSASQFFYMLSRNRSTCGVYPYVRASCNPDPDSFLASFLAWWIDQETGYPIMERSGVIRWFVRHDEEIIWSDSRADLAMRFIHLIPKSATFIPANIYDNQILMDSDPGYLANLLLLSLIDRERLLGGNWKVRPAAGKVFDRSWYEIVDAVPVGGKICRFWDFAATKRELKGHDPDYTAGVMMRVVKGAYFIEDCIDVQEGPAEVDRILFNTTIQDAQYAEQTGASYKVRWEREPGASGKRDTQRLVKMLAEFDARGIAPQGDKITRAKPFAAQSEAGNVKLLRGAWNEKWLKHMHHQPDWPHDDIMDGTSGAYNDLARSSAWGM